MSDNRTTIQDDMRGFLHRHPRMEMDLALDSNHAIVDMQDWKQARMQANGVQIRTEIASHIQNVSNNEERVLVCSHCGKEYMGNNYLNPICAKCFIDLTQQTYC